MQNFRMMVRYVDNSWWASDELASGKEMVESLLGDDFAAPPRVVEFEALTPDGKRVTITIPYDNSETVNVHITPLLDSQENPTND